MEPTTPAKTDVDVQPSADKTLSGATHQAAIALTELRDELRVRVHLGGMDARDAWDQSVAPTLQRLTQRLGDARAHMGDGAIVPESAKLQMHLAAMDARDQWRTLRGHIVELVDRLRSQAASLASETRDEARGWKEAKGSIASIAGIDPPGTAKAAAPSDEETHARLESVREALATAGHSIEVAARDAVREIRDAAQELRQQLEQVR